MLRRGFHTRMLCSLPNRRGISQSTPFGAQRPRWQSFSSLIDVGPPNPTSLWGPTSLLAHCLLSIPLRSSTSSLAHRIVSGSDTICNIPNSPLADIVLFELFLSGFPSRFLKRVCQEEVSTPLIKNTSFSSPTDLGSHTLAEDIEILYFLSW